jgi:hypothetical protein
MALALLTVAPVAAGQAMGNAKATLTGDAEVPGPGDPKGSGTVRITFNPDTGEVCDEGMAADAGGHLLPSNMDGFKSGTAIWLPTR